MHRHHTAANIITVIIVSARYTDGITCSENSSGSHLGFEKSQRSVTYDFLRYINILTYLLTYLHAGQRTSITALLTRRWGKSTAHVQRSVSSMSRGRNTKTNKHTSSRNGSRGKVKGKRGFV